MVPCGAQIAFTLTLSYTGPGAHPTVIDFTLPTGRLTPFPETISYTGGPIAIPDGDGTSIDIPLAVSTSTAISKVVFHLDGGFCTTDDGATAVGLDHTWVSDLTLSLTSPSGTTVTLANHAGGDMNDANNFCQTYFDDTSPQSIQSVSPLMAPFSGFFAPATPLASFAGENAAGTWTLRAADSVSPDGGSVRAFGIDVYGYSCAP